MKTSKAFAALPAASVHASFEALRLHFQRSARAASLFVKATSEAAQALALDLSMPEALEAPARARL